jgi:hypothetical protein
MKHVIEGKIERTGRRGRRHEELLDGFKEKRSYGNLEGVSVYCTPWITRFVVGCGPVATRTT